ncbi:MAG TPA: glycosyltransferase family 4 protein [Methylibium sp.]|uniref:glycosyltransferase family 4 protein n=1 Tax=Methylibium sp. TaxID=2067992 RepID=UPI002DB59596|nr:glycosyltransferase family 4 protein [Methylibium sp.]HEU4460470.1 glycosyltransferase family 4 protein [Methylibium sp.]
MAPTIAYLLNTYPLTSTTFIRREIAALEARGVPIARYAVRRWAEPLVEPRDIADQQRTHYLLSGNVAGLVKALFAELLTNTAGFARGLRLWARLCANQRELSPRFVAYLMQACYFRRRSAADGIGHVHAHFSTNATAVAMLAHAMGGAGYSFTAHGPDEFVDPTPNSVGLKVQRAAFVVAISQYCRTRLVLAAGMASWPKIVLGRCGLALDDFRPDYRFEPGRLDFVCVGRLCPQKAQVLIPPALALLKAEFPALKVHFVGGGESRAALEAAIAEHGVADQVVLHGWQGNDRVKELLAHGRALLLPSFAEGLPVVIMEALAMGRPVISTYIAGIPELVDEGCGWIVPAGSVEALADALRAAARATPAELEAKAREGRARVERQHDVNELARILEAQFAARA